MIRLTRLADYAVLLMTHMAQEWRRNPVRVMNAADLARETHIPVPTVSKILGAMSRGDLLTSHRGHAGGYALSRAPEDISAADIISIIEGPIALTECLDERTDDCEIESLCGVRASWTRINDAITMALEGISLAQMAHDQLAVFGIADLTTTTLPTTVPLEIQ
ncbi:MAG: SUF system Fe-S cluster assembly regulator [Alphaproteobacteria bacterium]|nr:MAG: SUF system Fe-S cluster assembly regulator [Alphaproteobacteria bacterium]